MNREQPPFSTSDTGAERCEQAQHLGSPLRLPNPPQTCSWYRAQRGLHEVGEAHVWEGFKDTRRPQGTGGRESRSEKAGG